jgi:uncharacterized repeat protein (TIGR03803 family)
MKNSAQRQNWIFNLSFLPATAALAIVILPALIAVVSQSAQAQTLTVLHNFTGKGDGGYSQAGLAMDKTGNLYGTASQGGTGTGVVFRLTHAGSGWVLTTLYTFNYTDGGYPDSNVTFGPDESLYGMTSEGGQYGYGVVYRLRPSPAACKSADCPWEETVLYSFTGGADGEYPGYAKVVFDQAGNLYGTTTDGGDGGGGVVFELTPSNGGWTESVLWSFSKQGGGEAPESGVIFDSAGNLYGTTNYGGTYDAGIVYELSPSGSGWTEQTLASIDFPRTNTCGGVVMDGHGNLFGAAGCFAPGYPGGVFELTPSNGSWTFNLLHAFSPGSYVEGPWDTPTLDAAGNVYGTSISTGVNGAGEVFKLTPSNGGWIYASLASFDLTNGASPVGSVVLDAAGNIYGTTFSEGSDGYGTVWEVTP